MPVTVCSHIFRVSLRDCMTCVSVTFSDVNVTGETFRKRETVNRRRDLQDGNVFPVLDVKKGKENGRKGV